MAPPPGGLSDEHASLRQRIRRRQPDSFPLSAYVSGWLQALVQLAVFVASLWMIRGETRVEVVWLWSIPFAWSWFALLMVGHDAMHKAFAPWPWVNEVVAFLSLDCLLFGRASWFRGHHVIHHAHPHSKEDMMYLQARSFAGDMWNLLRMVASYIASDAARLVTRPHWHEWLGMGVRIGLFWALMPAALLPAIFFLLVFGNSLGLLSHSLPVDRRTDDPVLRQLRTTWDLYPESFIASLVTGGLNAHVTHHVYPTFPRGAQKRGAQVLREEAGGEYRCVRSLTGLWTLFRFRHRSTSEIATIEAIGAGEVATGMEVRTGMEGAGMTPKTYPWLRNRAPYADDHPKVVTDGPVDLRVGERRVKQTTFSFPDRRMGDRRGGTIRAAA